MDETGQTLHDYVAGISVFVLTVAVVLGLLPSVVAPFQAGDGALESSQAKAIGDGIVANLSVAGAPNVLDPENVTRLMDRDLEALRTRFGLRSSTFVNVTVTNLNGSRIVVNASGSPTPLTAGASAAGEDASEAARIVRIDHPDVDCRPACRLLVRVW